jgi:hypothetical protein
VPCGRLHHVVQGRLQPAPRGGRAQRRGERRDDPSAW